jgi:hypothetical protein
MRAREQKEKFVDNCLSLIKARIPEIQEAYEVVQALYANRFLSLSRDERKFVTDGISHRVGFYFSYREVGSKESPILPLFGIEGGGASYESILIDIKSGDIFATKDDCLSSTIDRQYWADRYWLLKKLERLAQGGIDKFLTELQEFVASL